LNCFRIPMTRAAYNEFLDSQVFLNNLPPSSLVPKTLGTLLGGSVGF
jgi:hypothetical protein